MVFTIMKTTRKATFLEKVSTIASASTWRISYVWNPSWNLNSVILSDVFKYYPFFIPSLRLQVMRGSQEYLKEITDRT